jgi:hypothetical protein
MDTATPPNIKYNHDHPAMDGLVPILGVSLKD